MCFIALLYLVVPDYPVLLAANRDESRVRQGTLPQQVRPGVWAGLDPKAGGAWLCLGPPGRAVVVSNRRSEFSSNPSARSRGLLCMDMLEQEADLDRLEHEVGSRTYNPFNLLVADTATA